MPKYSLANATLGYSSEAQGQQRWTTFLFVRHQSAGIAVHLVDPIGQRGFAVVAEGRIQIDDHTIDFRRGMHRHRVHAAVRFAEQAQLPVRARRRVRPAPEQPLLPRQAKTVGHGRGQGAFDHLTPCLGQVLVRVEQQDPVVTGQVDRSLLLRSIALERLHRHVGTVPRCDLAAGVGRIRSPAPPTHRRTPGWPGTPPASRRC